MKPILLSGIQPTGLLHLGNYLGALKNFVALQNSKQYQCYFFAADYHSLTENFNPRQKSIHIKNLIIDYLAAGLNPQKAVIFLQSDIPAITSLAWILNCFTPLGELRRMTQFKEKVENSPQNINAGLLNYPILMAADILIFNAQFVPVGEDQLQHLELTRTLARRFNKRFGQIFVEPKPLLTRLPRLMSLDNPLKKMSKSRPAGCLFLNDSPNQIREKIKKAVTDSGHEIKYDPQNKPAISNLMLIYAELSNLSLNDVEIKFKNKNYSEFKKELVEIIIKSLQPFRRKRKEFDKNPRLIKNILASGAKKANIVANQKILAIKNKLGLFS